MSYGHSAFVPPPHMSSGGQYRDRSSGMPTWVENVKEYSSRAEDVIDTWSQPIKPYLPALGRFLIVVTFLEDAMRILMQWNDQAMYLNHFRSMPKFIAHLFLFINVVIMTSASTMVIVRRFTEYSVGLLLFIIVFQGLGYGLITDLNFFLRNLSVVGGLLMVLSDSFAEKKKNIFAGIPSISETDRRIYFQLAGRVLLVFLFLGFVLRSEWSILRIFVSLVGFGACIMVAVGFKARWSAVFLIMLLSILNVAVNNFWTFHAKHPHRDFLRYDFFQTLSIMGGLLLLVNMGPGGISLDERKKVT